MKSIRKILSVLTALAIIAVMFTAAAIPVYADPGDVFTVNAVPDGWRFYTSSCVDRENSGAQFGVKADKGKGLDNYGVLLANALSTEVVKPSTTYRISFNIYTWYNISSLQADVDTGTALWSRTKAVTTFSTLADCVTESSGGGDVRYSYDVSLDVTTPSTISGNQHFVLGVITKDGSTTTSANLRFRNITITEAKAYNVIDASTGESMGTIGAFPGTDTAKLIAGSAYDKDGFVFEASPATIEDATEEIVITYKAKREINVYDAETEKLLGTVFAIDGDDAYTLIGNSAYNIDGFNFEVEPEFVEAETEALYVTYTESPVQMIYFDKDYRGNSASTSFASWQQLATDGNGTLEIVNDKLSPRVWETGGIKMTAKTQFSNRAFVLANNYGKSGIVPGKTYRVIMRITLDTQYWTINQLNAEIKFGANVWNDLTDYATLSGEELAALVVDTEERDTVVDYILSMNIAVPEGVKNNIVMSLYGFNTTVNAETGEETTSGVFYTVDSVEIWNTYDVAVEDQNGEALGTVKARIGDSVEKAAKAYLGIHGDYKYTATAETVEALDKPIVLEKALRDCLVSFAANGGLGEMADEEVQVGEYVLPECEFTAPQGKAFKAWSIAGEEKQPGETITINDDTEVTAVWECLHENTEAEGAVAPTCTDTGLTGVVTCADCGTVIIPESLEVPALGHDYNAVVTEPACTEQGYTTHTCTRCGDSYVDSYVDALGHTASDWIVDKAAQIGIAGLKHKECTVCKTVLETAEIAALKAPLYTITYKLNGGTNASGNKKTYTQLDATFTLKAATRKGYTFGGWYSDSKLTKKVTKIEKGTTGNKTLYAKWTAVTYTITYKLAGGKNVSGNPKSYKITTSTITLKAPTRKGYKFGGWYSDSKFKTKVTKITKGSTGNKTLYAKWTVITYKITYKLAGGKNSSKNPKSYKVTTSTVTLKAPTRKGYTFKGWYNGSKKITKIAKGSTGNVTLTAKWTKKK